MSGRKIGIAALQLIERQSRRVLSLERWQYAAELSRLLIERGYRVEWWQIGEGWRTELLPGVPLWGSLPAEEQFHTYPQASEAFHEQSGGADGVIYFDPILAYPYARGPSLAIDHGVFWDDAMFEASLPTEAVREEWRRRLWSAYMGPAAVVATDTHVIQWTTATWPGMQHRFVYIPNFVPPAVGAGGASPSPAGEVQGLSGSVGAAAPPGLAADAPQSALPTTTSLGEGPLRLLFPSPLLPSEGVSVAIQAMEELLLSDPAGYRCHVTGGGSAAAEQFMAAWAERTGAHYTPQPLSEALLTEVDVVLFLAKSGQGTTMRCLQAMAAGKVVVVAQTGGLTDIVLHDHSGVIIPTRCEQLVHVLKELRQQPERCRRLGANARRVAATFSLERWRERWHRLIDATFGEEGSVWSRHRA